MSNDYLQSLDSAGFDALVLGGTGPIVVEFMSYSCAHCGAIEPALQQVAETLKSTETMFRVNITLEPDLAARWGVEGTPTLVMCLDGNEVGRVEGPSPHFDSLLATVTTPFGG